MILGTRGSPLALAQSGWVRARLMAVHPGLRVELLVIRTTGDAQQASTPDRPFGAPGDAMSESAKGIFVKEIEEAMLERRIDAAVHSLKDLPTTQPAGLAVVCHPPREDPRDVLVSREGHTVEALPAGARLGTSSPRRAAQLLAARPDLLVTPVRGNVDTRIRRMLEGRFDAVILAAAGLSRLGGLLDRRPDGARIRMIPEELCVPAVGQGALAIETREDDAESRSLVAVLHDPDTALEISAERSFLAALGGGCRVPVAARARATPGRLSMRGIVASPDGRRIVRVDGEAGSETGPDLGRRLAARAIEQGAGGLLGLETR
ncbi:MAG TPA: hydroxymethylbilane synthase [Candidatus Polarisedimenticolia bacterium]|nr:hydroxymethylbilane synthase [Candidatus Polarisedimenticolia bacterium]